jgi:hypothetical protein
LTSSGKPALWEDRMDQDELLKVLELLAGAVGYLCYVKEWP